MMKSSFRYNSNQNGDLLKPRTGYGQYVVVFDNVLFVISGLSNCTVSAYWVFLQCTMCTLFSVMPLYLLWPCIRYNQKKGGYRGIFREEGENTGAYFRGNHGSRVSKAQKCKKCTFRTLKQAGTNICGVRFDVISKVIICLLQCPIWRNDFSHSEQEWAFTPLWVSVSFLNM